MGLHIGYKCKCQQNLERQPERLSDLLESSMVSSRATKFGFTLWTVPRWRLSEPTSPAADELAEPVWWSLADE
jgi:hypothetical protein